MYDWSGVFLPIRVYSLSKLYVGRTFKTYRAKFNNYSPFVVEFGREKQLRRQNFLGTSQLLII